MTSSPKLLYIIGQLDKGGAEQQLYYLLSELPNKATVLSLTQGGFWAEPIRKLGHEVIELKRTKGLELKRFLSIIRLMSRLKPDVIHIFLDGVSALYSRFAGIFFRNAIIVIGERSLPIHYPKWYRFIFPIINRFVKCVICNSRKAIEIHEAYKFTPQDKLHYIPNAVNIVSQIDFSSTFNSKKLIVGIIGSITPQKDPHLFLSMVNRIHHKLPTARFWIVGEGGLRDECESRVKELGLDDIIKFWGQRNDVQELLNKMDIYCLTSKYEGTPNALLEAMAAGLPCVVTNAGDSGKLVNAAKSGFVVECGDMDNFSDAVLKLLGNPKLRTKMGESGFKYIKNNHTPAEMTANFLDLYQKLLSKNK